ncbi:hypothetical protein GW750_01450 [bacterium]|nr:hypothetical protein [bacterium]
MDKQQILQSAQAFLPLYETSFQSLQPKDYQTVIDSIDENIFVGIQPAE